MNKKLSLIVLFILSILTFYRLLRPGYFSMQDDMHVFRLQQFDKCLKDGQIPCRYIADGGFGLGYPLFNYYSPLPYLLGEIFHLVGFSFIDSLKIVFIIGHLLAPLGMFLLGSLFFGTSGGFLAAVLFMFAPYQATDSYVRGAIAEFLALNLIPLSLYFILKNNFPLAVLFTTLLFLSHNLFAFISLLVFLPLILIYLWFQKQLSLKNFVSHSLPLLFSLLLSAFFLLPAMLEKNLVTVDTMTQGYFYYVNHFATLKELFVSRFWGYGASLWGPQDDMSFQIGLIQWITPLIFLIPVLLSPKIKVSLKTVLLFFLATAVFFIFLTHNQSTFIWKLVPILPYFQFPWRFVGWATIFLCFLSGSIFLIIKKNHPQIILIILVTSVTIFLNFNYLKEDIWYPTLTDSQKLSGPNLIAQQGAGLHDYWPRFSQDTPTQLITAPSILSGTAQIISFQKNSLHASGQIAVSSSSTVISLPVVYFPQWKLTVNHQPYPYFIDPKYGQISFQLPAGNHDFDLKFTNTPIRTIANLISLLTLIAILGYPIIFKSHEPHR